MKRTIILCFALGLSMLQGCIVKSLHPFFRKADIVVRKELANTWIDENGEQWKIELDGGTSRVYQLSHYKPDGKKDMEFDATLFNLGDQMYLDIFPIATSNSGESMMFDFHMLRTHSIARIERLTDKEVQIRWLNEKWLQSLFSQNRIKISHEVVKDPMDDIDWAVILTASTEELQKFIAKYGDEEKAFNDNTVWLKLKR
jgi:hypothetical protein